MHVIIQDISLTEILLNYELNQKLVESATDLVFDCEYCGKIYDDPQNLAIHIADCLNIRRDKTVRKMDMILKTIQPEHKKPKN